MTLPLYSEGEDRSRGDRAHRPAADRATQAPPRASLYGESRPSVGTALRDVLLDDGTDTFNRVCTHIAIIMLGGLLAIYLETFL